MFCVNLAPRSRSKVKNQRLFATVYHQQQSSIMYFFFQLVWFGIQQDNSINFKRVLNF